MAYKLTLTANATNIRETQYVIGLSGPVKFSNFNSCVGIIVLDTRLKLSAVHLVQYAGADTLADPAVQFGPVQASAIRHLFPTEWLEVGFVGDVSTWKDGTTATFYPQARVPGFRELYNYFVTGGRHQIKEEGDGIYGGSVQVQRDQRTGIHYTLRLTHT